jgi:serine phosphatase RsbU (regulator of sigma subunit)
MQTSEFAFAKGDVMVLYTDGITEAKNAKGEEFGYIRLSDILETAKKLSSREIQDHIISSLYQFSESESLDDDYTTMIVKFN